ncbi:uncharacterized protein PAC_02529 [Phialocephala subalpina]|uniref:N-acetyltransferase domain-containing protein n=1 Tax=Phialocephala subalpina TaxID=576137 RepID=A0A1L7WIQ6_9HELO|nr:uncharacterized protein PAC_02529 [Phialocephala subalpina]
MFKPDPPQITHTPSLQLHLATPTDLPEITIVWYTCFPEPFIRRMFPDTPSLHSWWHAANSFDMANKPAAKFLIVRDHSKEGKGRIVGYAKWFVPIGDERLKPEDRFPKWSEESDGELCDVFFGQVGEERRELMDLCMLGTLPEYRRLGVASMLIGWATEQADRDGLECFVDASDKGRPAYEKFGFLGKEPFEIPGLGFACTTYIRPAKK